MNCIGIVSSSTTISSVNSFCVTRVFRRKAVRPGANRQHSGGDLRGQNRDSGHRRDGKTHAEPVREVRGVRRERTRYSPGQNETRGELAGAVAVQSRG